MAKKISPEEYWNWDKFEGETSAEDMKEDFRRYVKEHYGKNIEFVESDNPDTFKALFPTVEPQISKAELKEKMLKYGFTAPDMTVTEFVEDFESL